MKDFKENRNEENWRKNRVYIADQLVYQEKLGKDMTIEEGYEAVKIAMINALVILQEHLGSVDKIKRIVYYCNIIAVRA